MSKHIRVNGKLLNLNKRWRDLKLSQAEWIISLVREQCELFVSINKRLPMRKDKKDAIIDTVYAKIESEIEIWIPFREVKVNGKKYITRWNRKYIQNSSKNTTQTE